MVNSREKKIVVFGSVVLFIASLLLVSDVRAADVMKLQKEKGMQMHTPSKTLMNNAVKKSTSWTEPDTKRPGADYKNFPADGPEICQEVCADDPECRAYTFSRPDPIEGTRGRCFLKSAVPDPVGDDCCVSGVKPMSGRLTKEATAEEGSGGKTGGGMVLVRPIEPVDSGAGKVENEPFVSPSKGKGHPGINKNPVIQSNGQRGIVKHPVTPSVKESTVVKENKHNSRSAIDMANAIDIGDEDHSITGDARQGTGQDTASPYGDIIKSMNLSKSQAKVIKKRKIQTVTNEPPQPELNQEENVLSESLPEMLMVSGVIDRVIKGHPDCGEFRKEMIFMMHGGGYTRLKSGLLKWQYEDKESLSTEDPRVQAIFNANEDLNFRIKNLTKLHRAIRKKKLSSEFINAPLTAHKVKAIVDAISANLYPDRIKHFKELKLLHSSTASESKVHSHLSTYDMKDSGNISSALKTNLKIQEVCSMKEPASKSPEKARVLWENGYAFLLGKNFGWSPGTVFLEYIDRTCGGHSQRCEDLRIQGKPFPAKKVQLNLISKYSWTDRMIGVRLPKTLPPGLAGMNATETKARIRVLIPGMKSSISSPLVEFRKKEPFVTRIKTDSGFDPAGVLLYGHWVTSFETRMRKYIFWIRPHKLVYGAGLLNINCPDCPSGEWVEGGHLLSPGDNLYIYGLDFGNRPGDIFLTYDDPTKPGSKPGSLHRSIPVEPGEKDWWRDDRIHIRVKKGTPPPDKQRRPYLVIVDSKGHWITSNYRIVFTPKMAIKVVSGKRWTDIGKGEGDYTKVSTDGSAMIVVHPTGGCGFFDTNEEGRDWFFDGRGPRSEIRIIREEFIHLPPDGSEERYFKAFAKELALSFADKGLIGLFEKFAEFAGGNIVRSILGDRGANSVYPQKSNINDIHSPRALVDWENTCIGPYKNKPVKYYVRFIFYGPEHLLYPSK